MSIKDGVIIVGAGAAGCSVAYHLARRGITCQIIDREGLGCLGLSSCDFFVIIYKLDRTVNSGR